VSELPADALALAALVFLFGVRHGFDPDHLVAIDGFARSGGRWCGLFFSLGHGLMVTLIGVVVAFSRRTGRPRHGWRRRAWRFP
jgi:high-affinity nickel-transport protein